ncbi:hypothetical protein GGR57DRAFT_391183 [Xylariaceae sp. FL1272]|nr:hypothetical protein GGR57DRAFT_391183 [Xylariaceae sp. FL1272]
MPKLVRRSYMYPVFAILVQVFVLVLGISHSSSPFPQRPTPPNLSQLAHLPLFTIKAIVVVVTDAHQRHLTKTDRQQLSLLVVHRAKLHSLATLCHADLARVKDLCPGISILHAAGLSYSTLCVFYQAHL